MSDKLCSAPPSTHYRPARECGFQPAQKAPIIYLLFRGPGLRRRDEHPHILYHGRLDRPGNAFGQGCAQASRAREERLLP